MARTPCQLTELQRQIQEATGEPIEAAIRHSLRRTGEKQLTCHELGDIARTTLDRWLTQLGIDADAEIAIGKVQRAGLLTEVA